MEQIIEIFADAISGFILNSIQLQEQNAPPNQDLRKKSDVVIMTSRELIRITRVIAQQDYAEYPDIQSPILDCVLQVEKALNLLTETIDILFKETDRARGWKKLVDATKIIGSQTSRLLVVIYGSEQKRLERAANAALLALEKIKKFSVLPENQLRPKLTEFVNEGGDCSSKIIQFATFVGARSQTTKQEHDKEFLRDGFNALNQNNNFMIEDINSILNNTASGELRKNLAGTCNTLIDIINKIMGNEKSPEELDAFKIIENLFSTANNAHLSQSRGLDDLDLNKRINPSDIIELAKKAKQAISLVEQHPQRAPDDIINDTNISSNRVAQVAELLKIYNHQGNQPSMKDKLEIFVEKLDYGNEELVSKTNDYLSTVGNNDVKSLVGGSSSGPKDLSQEMQGIKESIKETIKATNQLKTSPGTQNFAPAARDLTNTIKQIIGAGKDVVNKVNDGQKTAELEKAISSVSDSIRAVIQNGKVVHQDPNNQNANEQFQNSISQLSQNMRNVLNETSKLNQPQNNNNNNNNNNQISNNKGGNNQGNPESQKLTHVCQDLQQTLDNLIEELMPPFSSLHDRKAPQPEKGSISMNKLRRLAEDAIAALEQLKPFRGYTPKETFNALEYALEAVDLFKDRLGSKANGIKLQALREKMLQSKKKLEGDSSSLLKDTEGYISTPKDPQARKVDKDIQDLIDEITKTMDSIQPSHISSTPGTAPYKGSVTPNDLKKQGELVKKDCNETQKQDTKMPDQIKKDVEKTFDDTDTFVAMVEKLSLDANNPGYKNFLNDATDKLRKAQDNMVRNANNLFDEPENPSHGKGINDECDKIKKLVDKIIEESTPRATVTPTSSQSNKCSPTDIEDAVHRMKEAVNKHDNEHQYMAPKELVNSAQDSSKKISDLSGMLKARANKTDNPELKRDLLNAANDLDKGNNNLVGLTNKYLDDPSNDNLSRNLSDECKRLVDIADEILGKIKPKANKISPGSVSSKFNGTITPKDIESLGQEVKKEVTKVQDYKKKAPATLVNEANVASTKAEQLADLLEKMAEQSDRPATKKKLHELAEQLRKRNDGMIDQLNAFIDDPDNPNTGKNLDLQCQDLKNFIDKIIDEVKPKVTVSKVDVGGEGTTPKDLLEAAKLAKASIQKLSNNHKTSRNEDIQKDAGDASTKLAKFTKLVDERSKKEKRPQVAQKLKQSTPELEKGNHKMVEDTNTYISDPKDPSTSKAVVNTCGDVCKKIDDIINELLPEVVLTPSSAISTNFKGIKNDQLKTTLEEVKKAVIKVKGFPKDGPKDISNNTGDASKKVATFAKQLLSRVEDLGGKQGDLAKTLKKTINDLEKGNEEMVKSAQNYLGDPDTPANAQDLDAACDLLLQILDDVWGELEPQVDKKKFTSTNILSTPTDLDNVGQQLKKAVTDVSQYDNKSPKQLVGKTEEASLLCDTFAQMLDKRAKETQHPELKNELLNAAKKIRGKNDDLCKDVSDYLSDPTNPNKQKKLTNDCDEIHKIVDDILSQVNPKLNPSKFGSTKVTNPSPDTIENAVKEMIASLEEVKKKKKVSPKSLVGATEDSSTKVTKTGDTIKAYAQMLNNPSLQRLCNDAFNELNDGHDRLIGTTNNFVKAPENNTNSQNLDDACDNLERIGRELIAELKPDLPDPEEEDLSHVDKVTIPMLKNAYAQAQKDLEEARKLDKTPSQLSQATQKAGRSINKFKALAKIRAKNDDNKEVRDLIDQLDKSNLDLHKKTRDFFGKPNDKNSEANLKKSGENTNDLLTKVFNAVKPSAKFSQPNFQTKQRNVTQEEVENLAQKIKDKLNNIDSYQSLDEDSLCDTSSGASSELATFAELIFMKANETNNPNLTEALKRNLLILPKEVTTRNQALVDKTNKLIESPEDENSGKLLKAACKNIKISIDSALDLVREATPKKDFRDLVLQAAGDIERAAKEWDCDDEIKGAALSIAEEMRKLAEAARKMDRKEIILRARNISDLVKTQIIGYAQPIQDNCIDKQLQKDVSTGVQALSNFSTQLKIMASVQAADLGMGAKSGKINTAENQLVACCKGISTSMKATLKSTQAAKIKKK